MSSSLLRAVGRSRSAHIWMIGVCQPDPVGPALMCAYSALGVGYRDNDASEYWEPNIWIIYQVSGRTAR